MKVNLSRHSRGNLYSSISSIKIILTGLLIVLMFHFSIADDFIYKFDNPEDEATCTNITMQKITNYRRISNTPLKWNSANECCKSRGMTLHTPELGDEQIYLYEVLTDPNSVLDGPTDYWTSGTSINGKSKWQFGSDINKVIDKGGFQRERNLWASGENEKSSPTKQCISAFPTKPDPEVRGGSLRLKKLDCKLELPFICQTEPQLGGGDLSKAEIELCKETMTYSPLDKGLQFGDEVVRWPVAKYCCEIRGWSLIGNIEPYQASLFENLKELTDEALDEFKFWTSLNDICKYRDFRWICGTREKVWWRVEPEKQINNPDDYGLQENCGEFYWTISDSKSKFYANDLNCDFTNYFICEEKPPCIKDQQFPCPGKEDRKVYPLDKIQEDMKECNLLKYSVLGTSENYTYYISSKELTWAGALRCLQNQSLDQASFQSDQDIEFFNKKLSENPNLQLWNTATSWKRKGKDLKWPDESSLNPHHRLKFKTHDQITPLCGKTTVYENQVGIMTENCLKLLKFAYKVPQETSKDNQTDDNKVYVDNNGTVYFITVPNEPDPFLEFKVNQTKSDTNFCPSREIMKLARMVCNSSDTSISRPKGNDTQIKRKALNNQDLFKLEFQNEKLKQMVVDFGVETYRYKKHVPIYGFKLLSLSATTYTILCPEVPFNFIHNGFRYFHSLHWVTSQGRSELLKESEYNSINKIMQTCWNNSLSQALRFRVDSCGEWTFSVDKCTNLICPTRQHQFNIKKYDPLVDMMWKVYELVHSACFKHFELNYRMFHKYAQAIMDLWSEEIRLRWRNQIETNKFWERILGPAYELHLLNMDKCNEAVIQRNLNVRLSRDTLPSRVRVHGSE